MARTEVVLVFDTEADLSGVRAVQAEVVGVAEAAEEAGEVVGQADDSLMGLSDTSGELGGEMTKLTGGLGGMVGKLGEAIALPPQLTAGLTKLMGVVSSGPGLFALFAAAAVAALGKIGAKFYSVYSDIQVQTGATGEGLRGLQEDFKAVMRETPADMEAVSAAISTLNTLTGATGASLQGMALQVVEAARLMKEDTQGLAQAAGETFNILQIGPEQAGAALDQLFVIAQNTGRGLTELLVTTQTYGPVLKNLGLDLAETAAFLGNLEKAGVDASRVMPGLNNFMRQLANEGVTELDDALWAMIEGIKGAETESEALKLATQAFGAEGAQRMSTAIRGGVLDLETLQAVLGDSQGAIQQTAEDTRSLGDVWAESKNRILASLEPVSSGIYGLGVQSFDTIMGVITPALEWLFGKFNWLAGGVGSSTRSMRAIIVAWAKVFIAMYKAVFKAGLTIATFLPRVIFKMLKGIVTDTDVATAEQRKSWKAAMLAIIRGVATAMRQLADSIRSGLEKILGFMDSFLDAWGPLGAAVRKVIGDIATSIATGLDDAADDIDAAASELEAAFGMAEEAAADLSTAFEGVGEGPSFEDVTDAIGAGGEQAAAEAEEAGVEIGERAASGINTGLENALKKFDLVLMEAEFIPTGDLPADFLAALQTLTQNISAKMAEEWQRIGFEMQVPALELPPDATVQEKFGLWQDWLESLKLAEEERFRERMIHLAKEGKAALSDEEKIAIAELMDAEKGRHDQMMKYLDAEGKQLGEMFQGWQAAYQAQQKAIRDAQKDAEEEAKAIHEHVLDWIDDEVRAEKKKFAATMKDLDQLKQSEEDRHERAMSQYAKERERVKFWIDDWAERIDDMKLALDQLKIDLNIEGEQAQLEELQVQLAEVQQTIASLEVFRPDTERERQRRREEELQRIRITTDEQRKLLESSRGLFSGEQLRQVDLLLAGYSQKAEVVRDIFAAIEKHMGEQVTEQQSVIDAKQAMIDLAEQEIAQETHLLNLAKDRAEEILKGIDEREAAETERYNNEMARLSGLVAAEKARHEGVLDALAEVRRKENERHNERMRQISEQYALELMRLDHTEEEIQQIINAALQRAEEISERARDLYTDIVEDVSSAGVLAIDQLTAATTTAVWGVKAVVDAVRTDMSKPIAIPIKLDLGGGVAAGPGAGIGAGAGGEYSLANAQQDWQRALGFAGKRGFRAAGFWAWLRKWKPELYEKLRGEGKEAKKEAQKYAGLGPFEGFVRSADMASDALRQRFFDPVTEGFQGIYAIITDVSEAVTDLTHDLEMTGQTLSEWLRAGDYAAKTGEGEGLSLTAGALTVSAQTATFQSVELGGVSTTITATLRLTDRHPVAELVVEELESDVMLQDRLGKVLASRSAQTGTSTP